MSGWTKQASTQVTTVWMHQTTTWLLRRCRPLCSVSAQLKDATSTHCWQGLCWDNLQKLYDCVGDPWARTTASSSVAPPCRSLPPWNVGVFHADTGTWPPASRSCHLENELGRKTLVALRRKQNVTTSSCSGGLFSTHHMMFRERLDALSCEFIKTSYCPNPARATSGGLVCSMKDNRTGCSSDRSGFCFLATHTHVNCPCIDASVAKCRALPPMI